ncbi:hypothetical protein [Azospira restricta]|uniref:Uncharacterized protein n=1 Tax=Azospira restricta TaxID=404405 RepID=A0A974SMZ9_9RHOO|nr:hypothetical protein [Azospira restricta]QRJ62724.1 hypothetical protein IWH25_13220 [Azospira restricta]
MADNLRAQLSLLASAEPADYVSRRRDLVAGFIAAVPSAESRDKLQRLQQSVDQLRALDACSARSLPEILDLIRQSLQDIVVLSERLKAEMAGE